MLSSMPLHAEAAQAVAQPPSTPAATVPQLLGLHSFPSATTLADSYDLILDAVFGFSFAGSVRSPFDTVLQRIAASGVPVASVDVPSGWNVESGPPEPGSDTPAIWPQVLISLTAPKRCAVHFDSYVQRCQLSATSDGPCPEHWLGGRFLPPPLAKQYSLQWLPKYPGIQQSVKLS